MNLGEMLYACKKVAGVFFIPIRIYDGGYQTHAFGLGEMPIDPAGPYKDTLLGGASYINYCLTPFRQCYGSIIYENYSIILGPVGRNEYTGQEKCEYAFELGVDQQAFERLNKLMLAIPNFSVPNFLHILLLANFCITRRQLYLDDIATVGKMTNSPVQAALGVYSEAIEPLSMPIHNHMPFERQVLAYVRMGDVSGLKQLFKTHTHGTTGMLAANRVRHLQNFFIMAVTLVSRAAIEGGLLEDEALRLSERYILQTERIFSEEAIISLLDTMLMDYTQRVADLENTAQISPLVSSVVSFVKQNIALPLDGQTLAAKFHISRKTLNSKFKAEMNKTVAEFVSEERIRKAESLLLYTDKSLVEIADYLGYASQSHFQTRFKAARQQTPLAFRREHKT